MERNLFRKLVVIICVFYIQNSVFADIDTSSNEPDASGDLTTLESYFLKYADESDDDVSDLAEVKADETADSITESIVNFPYHINEHVLAEIEYLTIRKRDFLVKSLTRAQDYVADMKKILIEEGVPQELVYLPVIESGFNYHAYSRKGAAGMWQFMPRTATWIGMKRNEWLDERLDPLVSCRFAAKYLRDLYTLFNDWNLALAAYNYGRGNVAKAIRRAGTRDYYEIVRKGIIPVETRKYVPRFNAVLYIMNNLEKFDIEFTEKTTAYEYITLDFIAPVRLVAQSSGMTEKDFMKYNPALRSRFVPGGRYSYSIRLPMENAEKLRSSIDTLKKSSYSDYVVYYIKRGDNLSSIATYYGVTLASLMAVNGISNSNRIWEGQKLLVPVFYKSGYAKQQSKVSTRSSVVSHIVDYGETVSHIALKYGVSADTIMRLNNLDTSYSIKTGQSLRIR